MINDFILDDATVTILIGENGTGKSRQLAAIAGSLRKSERRVIAIANTVFDRFPSRPTSTYARLSPRSGKQYALDVFKRALRAAPEKLERNASLIAKALNYTNFDPVLGINVRVHDEVDLTDVESKLRDEVSEEHFGTVLRALALYIGRVSKNQTAWIDLTGQSIIGPDRREILRLLPYEAKLKQLKILAGISILLQRGAQVFDLDAASSGELSLISTYAYLSTHIERGDIILIDEPENSLHPRWQRDYCTRLLDQFYRYDPQLVIATHSPHIVQGAQADQDSTSRLVRGKVRVIQLSTTEETSKPNKIELSEIPKSIDGTLFEAFKVLTPASHYLSEKVVEILNDLGQHRQTLSETVSRLRELEFSSIDEPQQEFLRKAVELARKIDQTR